MMRFTSRLGIRARSRSTDLRKKMLYPAICAEPLQHVFIADQWFRGTLVECCQIFCVFDEVLADGVIDEFGNRTGRLSRLHASGTKCAVHLDGTVLGLLPKLVQIGMDAIEAVTPFPVGDLSVEEMRRIADGASGGRSSVILWGGVPGTMFAPPYGWEDVARHVLAVLAAWNATPFVLGVADQVPPDGDIDRVRRISDMVGQ